MQLQIGARLQVECPAYMGTGRVLVRIIGYAEGISLLVTSPTRNGTSLELREGELLVVRAFSRQTAFAFRSSVIELTYHHGLEFRNLQPADAMVIKGLGYQQIIEDPRSVV